MKIGVFKVLVPTKKLFLLGGIFSVLISIYYMGGIRGASNITLYNMILAIFGHVDVNAITYLYPILIWILPQMILVNQLGNYLVKDITTCGAMIYTRTSKREKFLYKGLGRLFLNVCVYYVIQIIIMATMSMLIGLTVDTQHNKIIGLIIAINILHSFMIVLIINIMSLYINVLYSILGVMGLNILNLYMVGFVFEHYSNSIKSLKYLPFTQVIYSWHFDAILTVDSRIENFWGSNYILTNSIVYLLVVIVSFTALGTYRIKHMDIY